MNFSSLSLFLVLTEFLRNSDGFLIGRPQSKNAATSTAIRIPQTSFAAYPPRKGRGKKENNDDDSSSDYDPILDEPEGRRGDGRNWIEKSSPLGIGKLVEGTQDVMSSGNDGGTKETDGNYDLALNGISFQTGELSLRMYDALMSVAMKRFPVGTAIPSELEDVYKLYAMDITAKEAVKAALDQNGLELVMGDDNDGQNEDEGLWGDVENVQILDKNTGEPEDDETYDLFDDAVEEGDWEPGQPFSFIIRNVPARLKEMDVSEFLSQLDPEGSLREQAKEKGMTLPDEDVSSLKDLGKECDRRVNAAPYETDDEKNAYVGDGSKGYNIMSRSDLLRESVNADGTENDGTLMHVMDSLVSHGCLLVDLTDGGTRYSDAIKISKMWDVSSDFFDAVKGDEELEKSLPSMKSSEEAGSPHAVTGFATYGNGSMQFLETRIVRDNDARSIVPEEARQIIGPDGTEKMIDAFDTICQVGKDVIRVSVAATNMEYDAFLGQNDGDDSESSELPFISGLTFDVEDISGIIGESGYAHAAKLSSEAAALLGDELMDDGKVSSRNLEQGSINMSPHRFCRYEGIEKDNDKEKKANSNSSETFGAHTDTSFLTLVPVAKVSGLEVFDEAANQWFRPELLARRMWEKEQKKLGKDPAALSETITVYEGSEEKEIELPWHSRYLVVMPGELLQICTRNEVAAAVHRVVSVTGGDARFSAPVLLRARSGMRLNLTKYFGNTDNSLLKECDGMKMEDIHNALQPSSYRD